MTPLQCLHHLLAMATVDNRMNEAELGFLAAKVEEWGISSSVFNDSLQAAIRGEIDLLLPEGAGERRKLLKDLIRMMAADGNLDAREKELFAVIATSLEMDENDVHRVIDATLAENS